MTLPTEPPPARPEPELGPQYVRELDPAKVQAFEESRQAEQNLGLAILAGSAAALLGAGLWAVITVVSDYQIGWMAIGVAFLVGWSVRTFGKGVQPVFGLVGAGLALAGCLAGNFFTIAAVIAREEAAPLSAVFMFLVLNPSVDLELLVRTFSPLDLLFYGLALYYGYKYSFRPVTAAERESLYRRRLLPPER